MNKNLGHALMALGTVLMGSGMVPQLMGAPSKVLSCLAIAGFVCTAAGTFFNGLLSNTHDDQIQQLAKSTNTSISNETPTAPPVSNPVTPKPNA